MVGMSENQSTVPKGGNKSMSRRSIELKVLHGDESIQLPCMVCTRVREVKEMLAERVMVNVDNIEFYYKAGGYMTKQNDLHEVAPKTLVKGIKSFSPQAHVWPHPVGIIGTGYHGLKTAITYLKDGNSNIVCFDRNDRVGGYCWITGANKTSRLQTEFGSFHVWWGQDMASSGKVWYPDCHNDWSIWPGKLEIQRHFQYAADAFGMVPHCRFECNVSKMTLVGGKDDEARAYVLTVDSLKGGATEEVATSVIYNYPGSLTVNRIITYPGEDSFDGHIRYGMNDDTPYEALANTNVAILGNGAFAVENARTCCECGADKIFLVTRRKNLASPRVPCWFVHQGPLPTPGGMVLKMFEPMYELCGMGDPWSYWSVHSNSDRTNVNIIQNSRFGIGDVTFLAVIWGRLEYVESTVKRCTHHTLHLHSGRKLEDVQCIVKSLGLVGDFEVDRLHGMKELVGNWCSGDFRRVIQIDPLGMNAANFTTFSTGIGTYGSVMSNKYLHDFPQEYGRMAGAGLLQQLPRQKADEKLERPAYVTDVKFQMAAGIIIDSMCPRLQEKGAAQGPYKHELYHRAHPLKKFLQVCKEDWDQYQAKWKEEGFKHDYVEYPYTYDIVAEYFKDFSSATGFQIKPEGPDIIREDPEGKEESAAATAEDKGTDEATRTGFEQMIKASHNHWWAAEGPKRGTATLNKAMSKTRDLQEQPYAMR